MKNCLIFGSGRSGTSMLSGILHDAGYYMGENLYHPNEANPKGFFENGTINGINEMILSCYQSDERFNRSRFQRWLMVLDSNIKVKCKDAVVINEIEEETSQPFPFGYKDPRFSYTLPVWLPYLPNDTKLICIFRKPQDTVQSVVKECVTADYLDDLFVNEEYLYSMWENVYKRILNYEERIQKNIIYIHYNQVFDKEVINKLSNILEVELDNSFADIELKRTNVKMEYVPQQCVDIYNELCRRSNYDHYLEYQVPSLFEEVEILRNRLANKELLLHKKSKSLRQLDYDCSQNLSKIDDLEKKLKSSNEESESTSARLRRLEREKLEIIDTSQDVLHNAISKADGEKKLLLKSISRFETDTLELEKKAREDKEKVLHAIYSSYTWRIGRLITLPANIILDLALQRKLNRQKGFLYCRAIEAMKSYFVR